jgi:hypothetical protein
MYCAVWANHRSWAKHGLITDPAHAAQVRHALTLHRQRRQAAARHHSDGHAVTPRALPDYDALFGVDFSPTRPRRKRRHHEHSHQDETPAARRRTSYRPSRRGRADRTRPG